jgi:hypothetical protein
MVEDSTPMRIVYGVGLVVGTGVIQVIARLVLGWLIDVLPTPRLSRYPNLYMTVHTALAVLVLLMGMILQVTLWALFYHFHMGELGDFASSVYFSMVSFTTLGANELNLSHAHRMIGALESAVGMLMFGWSTALLVKVVHQTDRHPPPPP